MQVEQAIFAPSRSDTTGYHVVASSPGVCQADLRELATWGPSNDSLLDSYPESLNFHPLPSGAYCVSRTVPLGCHGGRQQVMTHCLVVPRQTLARFDNNPFALASATADLWHFDRAHQQLAPATITGGAPAVNQSLLEKLAAAPGPEKMAALVQAGCQSLCLAVADNQPSAALMAGLLNCVPPECRLEFSFSTGLKFSPRRPFRLLAMDDDPAQRCWLSQYSNIAVLDLRNTSQIQAMPLEGWAQLIQRSLATGSIPFLAAELSKRRFQLTLDDLPALGLQLLETLDSSETHPFSSTEETEMTAPLPVRRGHGAHRQFVGSNAPLRSAGVAEPAARQHAVEHPNRCAELDSPEILDRLEQLDDLVYDAINGQPGTMEKLEAAWPRLAEELGDDALAESREQYLRYALSVWDQCVQTDGIHRPTRAVQALDVLCLLFGDAV